MNEVWSVLLNSAILSAFLTAAVWLVLRLTPRRLLNAATRDAIWWITLAAILALPLVKLPTHKSRPASPMTIAGPPTQGRPNSVPEQKHSADRGRVEASPVVAITPEPTRALSSPPPTPAMTLEVSATGERALFALAAAWIVASLFLLIRLILDCAALGRLKSRASEAPLCLRERANRWLAQCRVRRSHVRLATSAELEVPVAAGPRHPSILIPVRFIDNLEQGTLSSAELDQIGLHESAHLSRYDDYALLLQRIIEALFVFHPVVRFITRQIDLEREIACDDFVVAATSRPDRYAYCLTRIAENSADLRSSLAAAPVANDLLSLTRRVEMLLDLTRNTGTRVLRGHVGSMAVVVAVFGVVMANTPGIVALATPLIKPSMAFLRSVPGMVRAPQSAAAPGVARAKDLPGELEGRVVEDSSGNPLASAEIRFHRTGMRELAADLETDREGVFRSADLPAGDYTVDVSKPNFMTAAFPMHVPGRTLNVRLIRYGIIDGQATDESGHSIEGRRISPGGQTTGSARIAILAKSASGEFRSFRQLQIEGGRYRVFDLPPGEYEIGLWFHGLNEGAGIQLFPDNSQPRIFTISGGEEYRDINFAVAPQPFYSVSGKVELSKASDSFALALGLPGQPALPLAQTLTGSDGAFRFEKIPAGVYDLFVAGPTAGYGAYDSVISRDQPFFGRARVQVAGLNVENLDVPVAPGRTFNMQLRSADHDRPPAGCPQTTRVLLSPLEPWGIMFQVDAHATFGASQPVSKLAPGKFELKLTDLGSGCYQVSIPVIDLNGDVPDPVTIEVASAGAVHGTLALAGNAPPNDFVVVLVDAAGAAGAPARIAFPDSSRKFTFEGIPPGRYRIAAQAAAANSTRWVGDLSRMQEIEVPGDKPISITLAIPVKGVEP